MRGQEKNFDPDALVQNAVVALCGFHGTISATPPASDEVRSDGACWLIETPEQPPRYWSGGNGGGNWSHSPDHAVRFKRAADAVTVMQWARLRVHVAAKPVEHVWMAAQPDPAPALVEATRDVLVERDAARYRAWRDSCLVDNWRGPFSEQFSKLRDPVTAAQWDAAVDAAIALSQSKASTPGEGAKVREVKP